MIITTMVKQMDVKQKVIECIRKKVREVIGYEDEEVVKRTVFLIVFGFEPEYIDRLNKGEPFDIYSEIEEEYENIEDVDCGHKIMLYYYNGATQEVSMEKLSNLLVIDSSVFIPNEGEEEYKIYINLDDYKIGML